MVERGASPKEVTMNDNRKTDLVSTVSYALIRPFAKERRNTMKTLKIILIGAVAVVGVTKASGGELRSFLGARFGESVLSDKYEESESVCNMYTYEPKRKFRDFNTYIVRATPVSKRVFMILGISISFWGDDEDGIRKLDEEKEECRKCLLTRFKHLGIREVSRDNEAWKEAFRIRKVIISNEGYMSPEDFHLFVLRDEDGDVSQLISLYAVTLSEKMTDKMGIGGLLELLDIEMSAGAVYICAEDICLERESEEECDDEASKNRAILEGGFKKGDLDAL